MYTDIVRKQAKLDAVGANSVVLQTRAWRNRIKSNKIVSKHYEALVAKIPLEFPEGSEHIRC